MENGKQGAFATSTQLNNEQIFQQGLTKREYFAVKAMQGLCAVNDKGSFSDFREFYSKTAEHSVYLADYLLKELDKGK